jgi:hypothetical protein
VYTSAEADRLVLKGRSFGRDVIVQAGYWRFWQHATLDEILDRFRRRQILLARAPVHYLIGDFLALLRAAQPAKVAAHRAFFEQHGMILGVDGMQPEKGNDCLYIVRETQVGLVLGAEHLSTSSQAAIADQVLAPVQAWGFTIRGIVSDAQETIQQAVAQQCPGVPHHTCHFHGLRDAGKLTFEADRAMKTPLKKALRSKLSSFWRGRKRVPEDDPCRGVLADYGACLRSLLLLGGIAPCDLGGLRLLAALQAVEGSLRHCQEKGGIRSCPDWWVGGPSARPLPGRRPGSNASWSGWENWKSDWIGRKTSTPQPTPRSRFAKMSRTIWTNWTPWTWMKQTARWPNISSKPSGTVGGAYSRATRWPTCPAPTTIWRPSWAI